MFTSALGSAGAPRIRACRAAFALALAFAGPLSAQVVATVGPPTSPVGGTVWISVSNDTSSSISLSSPCPFLVLDTAGNVVYGPFCPAVIQPVAAGAVYTTSWGQTDGFGVQVAPGNYVVRVFLPGGQSNHTVAITPAIDAGIAQLGAMKIGTTRALGLTAPADGGFAYIVGASFTPGPAIFTCGGIIPLAADALLVFSLTPGNGVFADNAGILDAFGDTTAPTVTVPNQFALVGANFWVAGVVLDFAASCPYRSVSGALSVTIL
jgi:hypothetical protein